jgi:hypothetical protein
MNRLRERITSIKMTDQGCMLRAYSRNVIDTINQCGEVNTFMPALAYTFSRTRPKSRSSTRSARRRIEVFAVQPDPPELRPGHRLLARAAAVVLDDRHDAVARSAACSCCCWCAASSSAPKSRACSRCSRSPSS